MSEFQRQHPVAAITRAIDLIRNNLITIIVLVVVGAGGTGGTAYLWWFAGLLGFLLIAGTAGWWRFVYRVENGELQINQGIFVRKNLYLTRDRIQVIDVSAGVVQRMFGLVSIEVKTAGSTSREASLSAVTKNEADRLVMSLRNNGTPETADSEAGKEINKEYPQYPLSTKELMIAASTSGSFGIALSIIATIFSQIEPLIEETQMYEWILSVIPSDTDALFIISILIVFAIFAWLMSFFGTLFKYGDFRLTVKDEEIVITRGIFEKKRITVPFNRIQAIRIVEGTMRQPFGYASLHVESAGYGEQQDSGSVVLFPLIKSSGIEEFFEKIIPGYFKQLPSEHPPARSATRYVVRSAAVLAMVILAIYWVTGVSNWIWFFLLPGILWGWMRYKDAAVGADDKRIIVRSRTLARTTAIVMKNRTQDMSIRASWIQRFRNLANLEVNVASGDQGRSFQVRELDVKTAEQFLPWITSEYSLFTGEAVKKETIIPDWKM